MVAAWLSVVKTCSPSPDWITLEGIGSSPIVYKNLVIVQCDIQRNSFIAAFDAATGKEVWRTVRDEIPSWSTPTIFESNDKAELVTQAPPRDRGVEAARARARAEKRFGVAAA